MSEHTPTPWHWFQGHLVGPEDKDKGGAPWILRCTDGGEPTPEDAEFIGRVCNSHDDLLAALEGLVDDIMDAGCCHTCSNFAEKDGHKPDCHVPAAIDAIDKARIRG